jgi:hypothetical protein
VIAVEQLFTTGRAVDLILAVMFVEAAWLMSRPSFRTPTARLDLLVALAPGALILLALRAALTGADWRWIALALAASFPAHILDLQRRRPGRR